MELLLSPAFTLWGSPASWLELLACVLALAMVGCNMREIHWAWPLAITSSLLYWALFWRSKLYAEAMLQIFFAVLALWGWWQWLRGRRAAQRLRVAWLSRPARYAALAAVALLWPAIALFLQHFTDSDVPWPDAFVSAASLVGQYLLGRKYIENWLVWLLVNLFSVALFAYKNLWLTMLLYAFFAVLSALGWRSWQRRAVRPAT